MTAMAIVVAVLAAGLARRSARHASEARIRLTRAQAEAAARERAVAMALEARARLAIAAWHSTRARPQQGQALPLTWPTSGGTA